MTEDSKIFGQKLFFTLSALLFMLYGLHFAGNFAGTPAIKYTYLAIFILTSITVFTFDFSKGIFFLIPFTFIEGQGKILYNYAIWVRMAMDLLIIMAIFRHFIREKRIFFFKELPGILSFFISLHFIWFVLEIFNVNSPGILINFINIKIYIIPFLLFFSFLSIKNPLTQKEGRLFFAFAKAIIITEIFLCLYQFFMKEPLLISISNNYQTVSDKFLEFQGDQFRPWGTSHLPGGFTILLYVTAPFFFIRAKEIKKRHPVAKLTVLITIILSWALFFVSNIRSAWIKHILITIGSVWSNIYGSKTRLKSIIQYLIVGIVLALIGATIFTNLGKHSDFIDISYNIERIEKLGKTGGISDQRAGLDDFARVMEKYTNFPFGWGPGSSFMMLPAFANKSKKIEKENNIMLWSHDNLFIATILELGIGGIIYSFIIILVPILLLRNALIFFIHKDQEAYELTAVSGVVTLTNVIGQWGSTGIPFNPESFYFWFWAGLGFAIIHQKKQVLNNPNKEHENS